MFGKENSYTDPKNVSLNMLINLFTSLVSVIFHMWMTFEGFCVRNFKL